MNKRLEYLIDEVENLIIRLRRNVIVFMTLEIFHRVDKIVMYLLIQRITQIYLLKI